MSFLAPFALLLVAVAGVPLALHFLRRRIGSRVRFPAVRYLARAEREHSRQLRLRNLLLLLLRVATVVAIALAAAKPLGILAGGHPPVFLAIVLDNSLSSAAVTGGRLALHELRDVARRIVQQAAAGDQLALVTADGRTITGSAETLGAALARITPLTGAGDPASALRRAASLTRVPADLTHSLVLLTDGQRSSWSGTNPLPRDAPRLVVYLASGEAPRNRSVLSADARPARWTPSGTVVARLQSPDSVTYRIALRAARTPLRTLARGTMAAGEASGEITVRAAPPERGWVSGIVELAPDELRADDTRHFAAWIGPAPLVSANASAGPFAGDATNVLRASGRVADAPPNEGIAVIAADLVARLPAIITAPRDPVRAGVANRALERLDIPWRFGEVRRDTAVARGDRVEGATVTWRFALVPRAKADAGDTLATVSGAPWIVAGPRYVLIASPLEPTATTLPVSAAFVPWLYDAVSQRLSNDAGHVIHAPPRGLVPRPSAVQALERPDGGHTPVTTPVLSAPETTGVYFFLRGARRAGALVVNAEERESVLERSSPEELRSRLGARDIQFAHDAEAAAAMAFTGTGRRSLLTPLLLLAAALLVAETIVVAATRRSALPARAA